MTEMNSSFVDTTLSNGLEVTVASSDLPTVSIYYWVDVGSIDEKPAEAGYSHFVEHMLFKGTHQRTTQDIAGTIEQAGGEMNAFTSFEYTAYYITVPADRWKLALEVLSDMVFSSAFFKKEFTPEKEVILEEIKRGEDSPDRKLYQGIYKSIWGDLHYGRPVIGYSDVIRKSTEKKLKAYWSQWYCPQLMNLAIAGGVQADEALKEVKRLVGQIPPGKRSPRSSRRREYFQLETTYKRIPSIRQQRQVISSDVGSARVVMNWPGVPFYHPDAPALDTLAVILGGSEISRLYSKLHRDQQLVSDVSTSSWTPVFPGVFSIDLEVKKESHYSPEADVMKIIHEFVETGPTQEELERAVVGIDHERAYGTQVPESVASRLGYLKLSCGQSSFDLEYQNKIRSLTKTQLIETARKYLTPSYGCFLMKPKDVSASQFGFTEKPKVLKSSTSSSKKKKTLTSGSLELPAPQIVHLSDQLTVLLFERKTSQILCGSASLWGGSLFEKKEQAGLGQLLAGTLDKAPQGMTFSQYVHQQELLGARIHSGSGKNSMTLSLQTPWKNWKNSLSLFLKTLQTPAFESSEVDLVKFQHMEDLKTFEDHSSRIVENLFARELFGAHPYSYKLKGELETVQSFDRNSVQQHYHRLRQHGTVLSLVGPMESDEILDLIRSAGITSSKSSKKAGFDPAQPPVYPLESKERILKKQRQQSHLIYGFPGLRLSDPDRPVLTILTNILGGMSGRLFREIRDKKGLCYEIAPLQFEGLVGGYYGVYMGCDPSKTQQGLQEIQHQFQNLMKKGVSQQELNRAKSFLAGKHCIDSQWNSSLATTLGLHQLYGIDLDRYLRFKKYFDPISSEDVRRVARRIFEQPSVTAIVE